MKKLNATAQIDLYKILVDEHQFYLTRQSKDVAFFSSLLISIMGATAYGFVNDYPYEILMVGSSVSIIISHIALSQGERVTRRILEVIAMRAKIEHDLGMHLPRGNGKDWVADEHLINSRNYDDRYKKPNILTSGDWVEERMRFTYQNEINNIFHLGMAVGALLIAFLAGKMLWTMRMYLMKNNSK